MSSKKLIIDKDRFSHIKNINDLKPKGKSRFDQDFSEFGEKIHLIELTKLVEAPKEWNFYKKLNDDKFFELLESIRENYLLNPIIVWEKTDSYMILSGHNRVAAFEKLYEITEDDDYEKIPAIVKGKDEISELEAKSIIIDTNWVQRQLSAYEKTKSVIEKYTGIDRSGKKGKTRDLVASSYGISGRMVQNYMGLQHLNEEIFDLIEDKKCTIKQAVQIAKKSQKTQEIISKKLLESDITVNDLRKISENAGIKEIEEVIKKEENDVIDITVKIPIGKKNLFFEFFEEWKKINL